MKKHALRRLALCLTLCALPTVFGCGQKGPLYLRDNPPSGVKPPKPEAYTPLPYPKESGEDPSADGAKK